jgi:hypothetical protein
MMTNTTLARLREHQEAGTILGAEIKSPRFRHADKRFSGVDIIVHDVDGEVLDDNGCFVSWRDLGLKRSPDSLPGLWISVMINELEPNGPKGKRFTFSRVRAVAKQLEQLKGSEGTVLIGKVVTFVERGALINIGNEIVGMVKREELCADFSKKPGDVLKIGELVPVELLKVDGEHVYLSYRKVVEPAFVSSFTSGDVVVGTVVNMALSTGTQDRPRTPKAFVNLGGPVDGCLRQDKLKAGVTLKDAYQVGQERLFRVTFVDAASRKIRLKPFEHEDDPARVELEMAALAAGLNSVSWEERMWANLAPESARTATAEVSLEALVSEFLQLRADGSHAVIPAEGSETPSIGAHTLLVPVAALTAIAHEHEGAACSGVCGGNCGKECPGQCAAGCGGNCTGCPCAAVAG